MFILCYTYALKSSYKAKYWNQVRSLIAIFYVTHLNTFTIYAFKCQAINVQDIANHI